MTYQTEEEFKIGIVIPCFNEAMRLNVDQFTQLATFPGVDWLIVDDGSTDDTLRVLGSVNMNNRMRVLSLSNNLGKSEAIRHGLNQLLTQNQYKGIGFLDADSSISASSVLAILDKFRQLYSSEFDMVWSSRIKLSGRKISRSNSRHLIGRAISIFLGHRSQLPYDSQCGYKIFKVKPGLVSALEKSFRTKWFVDLEILTRCIQHDSNTTVWEEPVGDWKEVPGSKINFSQALHILQEISYIKSVLKTVSLAGQK
jgi:glycosyltransferase involved in cell wall biosynthesis